MYHFAYKYPFFYNGVSGTWTKYGVREGTIGDVPYKYPSTWYVYLIQVCVPYPRVRIPWQHSLKSLWNNCQDMEIDKNSTKMSIQSALNMLHVLNSTYSKAFKICKGMKASSLHGVVMWEEKSAIRVFCKRSWNIVFKFPVKWTLSLALVLKMLPPKLTCVIKFPKKQASRKELKRKG